MNYDDLVRRLRDYVDAYPEDMFPPLTMEEKQQTTVLPGLFARGCAQMGRTFGKCAAEAASAIQELQRDALRYRWLRQAGAWESELGIDELCENPDKFDAAVDEAMQHDPRG